MKKFFFICIIQLLSSIGLYSADKWELYGDLLSARHSFEAVALNNDSILVVGGRATSSLNSCEIIDIKNKKIYPAASMSVARADFILLVTKDSNYVVIGGFNGNFNCTKTVELFDRKTMSWKVLGSTNVGRMHFTAQFINENEILIVGGRASGGSISLSSAEIFNIQTGISRNISDFPSLFCDGMSAITSKNDIVFFGWREAGETSKHHNEIYKFNINTEKFELIGSLADEVQNPSVLKLDDGRVFISGGSKLENPIIFSHNITIEKDNIFSKIADLPKASLLAGINKYDFNSLIIVGGFDDVYKVIPNCYIYNLSSNTVSNAPDLNHSRARFKLISMPNKNNKYSVFAIGGSYNNGFDLYAISSIELLEPEGFSPPKILGKKTQCSDYFINVHDENDINKIEFIENNNCTLNYSESLPSNDVNIKISLQNINKNGYFKLRVYCEKTDKELIIIDSISFLKMQIMINSPQNDIIIFDSITNHQISDTTIILKNKTNSKIILDKIFLSQNTNFSIPQGQLPIIIEPNSTKEIKICFSPFKMGILNDTLWIIDTCKETFLLLEGFGAGNHYLSESNCNIILRASTAKYSDFEVLSAPYPNPAQNAMFFEVLLENTETANDLNLKMFDMLGNIIDITNQVQRTNGNLSKSVFNFLINLSNISNGNYFIALNSKNKRLLMPILVNK